MKAFLSLLINIFVPKSLLMKNKVFIFFCLLYTSPFFAQDFTALWQGHYSYLNIVDVVQGNGKVYAASENAIFVYDTLSLEIKTIDSVNGLSGESISTIHYSQNYELLIIGYESGLMEIHNDSEESVLTVVDILNKPTIPPNNKRINHFNEYNNLVYIATDYGVSVYDLERLEFGDTYFIGNGGSQIIVTQTAVFGDYIYASCKSESGIRRALTGSDNLINFQEWIQLIGGNFVGIETINDDLYTTRQNNKIYRLNGSSLSELFTYPSLPLDIKASEDKLVITIRNQVFVYDSSFNLLYSIPASNQFNTLFTSATVTSEALYIGTEDFGVLRTTPMNLSEFIEIHPDGPLRNDSFSIQASFNNVWVSYGDYSLTFNPSPLKKYGISHLKEDRWINTRYDSIEIAVGSQVRNLNSISINPFNSEQVFISSFVDGILEINDDEPTVLYNQDNSGLESLSLPNNPSAVSIRVSASTFDINGLLWSMTARIDKPLKSYDPSTGLWRSYDFTDIIPNGLTDEFGFGDLVVGNDGTKWVASLNFGVIGYNENNGNPLIRNIADEEQSNLPSTGIKSLALDNRNQLWIGTIKGLRVLFNTSNFFSSTGVTTQPIIILEDGIPKELLEQQFISDIKVDGSNNKWIGTIGSGLFYFSPDGQETIFHFTKDNSPLPSNNIIDIALDSNSGIVYIATDKGLLSYSAGGSSPQESLTDAYVYPNPVRPAYNIVDKKVKITDISENCNIKITDIEGNLVAEAQTNTNQRYNGYNLEIDGGTAFWNGKNLSNNTVSTGVYLIMISDLDNLETKVLKLMVVR